MRCALMLCVLAFAACRSGAEAAPTHAEPPPPITATPTTAAPLQPQPPPTTGTSAPPALAPPLLPPRAAVPERSSGGSGPQCQKDADCALTRVPAGDCCPSLCAPRAVTARENREIEERVARCERENHPCPMPACRARAFEAACVGGACTARLADDR